MSRQSGAGHNCTCRDMLGMTLSAEDSAFSMSMSPDMLGAIWTAIGAGLLSLCSGGDEEA